MTTTTATKQRGSARGLEAGLLARLGLPSTASTQEVETAHDALIGFLETAPADLRSWAKAEIDKVDEAYALLFDPTIDRSALAASAAPATPAPSQPSVSAAVVAADPTEWDDDVHEATSRPAKRTKARRGHAAPAPGMSVKPQPASGRPVRRLSVIAAAVVGVVAVVLVVFNMGGGTGIPGVNGTPEPQAAASAGVDTARVGQLMQKIQADPKDVASLQALADIYYQASDYEAAGGFLDKILIVDPKNLTARLAQGAALFNLGKPDLAETQWRMVLATDPNNLEAHYDLGFLYLSRNPADLASAKVEWTKVIEIAPASDVAKTVQQHLASLDATPAPGASSKVAPSPAASSAPSPVASPAASGN